MNSFIITIKFNKIFTLYSTLYHHAVVTIRNICVTVDSCIKTCINLMVGVFSPSQYTALNIIPERLSDILSPCPGLAC